MEIYPIRTESGERMIMVYFPQHRLLYASDLIQPSGSGLFRAQYAYEVVQAVKREGLVVERVFAMHSDVAPWRKVLETVSRSEGIMN